MTAAISLADLAFQYPRGGFVLELSSLQFPPAELTFISGPNGSGKTTLSKLMAGILRPQKGEVRLFGKRANNWPLGKIGRHVGYLFQDPSRQLFAATVWQEMTFVHDLLGQEWASTAQRAEMLLERFGLLHLKNRGVYHLSGGEKQRLALCTILMAGAGYLILDEPTTGLDQKNRQKLYALMEDLLDAGKGLAVITHEDELLNRYQARQVQLENGRVLV